MFEMFVDLLFRDLDLRGNIFRGDSPCFQYRHYLTADSLKPFLRYERAFDFLSHATPGVKQRTIISQCKTEEEKRQESFNSKQAVTRNFQILSCFLRVSVPLSYMYRRFQVNKIYRPWSAEEYSQYTFNDKMCYEKRIRVCYFCSRRGRASAPLSRQDISTYP